MKQPMMVAALIVGALGCLFVLIGMATPGWVISASGYSNAGLFTACLRGYGCGSYSAEGAVVAVRAFVVLAFFCSLAAIIEGLVYYFKYVMKDVANSNLPLISAVLYVAAAVLSLLGVIVFAAKGKEDLEFGFGLSLTLGYSFGLAIVGALLCAVAGALTFVHRRQST